MKTKAWHCPRAASSLKRWRTTIFQAEVFISRSPQANIITPLLRGEELEGRGAKRPVQSAQQALAERESQAGAGARRRQGRAHWAAAVTRLSPMVFVATYGQTHPPDLPAVRLGYGGAAAAGALQLRGEDRAAEQGCWPGDRSAESDPAPPTEETAPAHAHVPGNACGASGSIARRSTPLPGSENAAMAMAMAADPSYPRTTIEDDFNYGSSVASASVHVRMGGSAGRSMGPAGRSRLRARRLRCPRPPRSRPGHPEGPAPGGGAGGEDGLALTVGSACAPPSLHETGKV